MRFRSIHLLLRRLVAPVAVSAAATAALVAVPWTPAAPADAAIPSPAADQAVVVVYVGGDRTSAGTVGPLAGATFGLFATDPSSSIDSSGFATATPDYRCTSDSDGNCSFVVPIGGGAGQVAQGTRLWAAPISGPAGYYSTPYWQTGPLSPTDQDPLASLRRVYQTPLAGQSYLPGAQWLNSSPSQTSPANSTPNFTRRIPMRCLRRGGRARARGQPL